MKPSEVIKKLQETNSRLDKEAIIDKAWQEGCIDFFEGARLCFDSLITFGVKQVPERKSDANDAAVLSGTFNDFVNLTDKLRNRELTGYAARDAIEDLSKKFLVDDWNNFYRLILIKDLKSGVSEVTINKVLKKQKSNKANNYIIKLFECQLAYDCEGREKKFNDELLLEHKFDGVRILAVCNKENKSVILYTRNGKENHNFPKVIDALQRLLPQFDKSYVFDGEMMSADFQALMRQLNRKENVDTKDSVYHVFDVIPLEHFRNGYSDIHQHIRKSMLASLLPESDVIKRVDYKIVNIKTHREEFENFKTAAVEAGLEGIMIKNPNAPYECKRTEHWMKYKPVITVDLTVVGVIEGEGNHVGMLGSLVCEGEYEGMQVKTKVGSGFTEDLRKEMWADPSKVIGRMIEAESDCLTKSKDSADVWSLRFPRFLRFRDDK